MKITTDFPGGNVIVREIHDNTVYIKADLRDTIGDWFYWAFCVEGAQGRTVTFDFTDRKWVGFMGAAKSRDLEHWQWTYDSPQNISESFTYTFAEDEDKVYFAHHMLYLPDKLEKFMAELKLDVKTFCQTEKGRDVPYFEYGDGDEVLLLAARHHACESTGSYILEGVIRELYEHPINGLRIICVPMADIDGITDGDQGKNRAPHDHNRDYDPDKAPIYNVTSEIRRIALTNNLRYAFDFHAPWHTDKTNFIPQEYFDTIKSFTRFANILEKHSDMSECPFHAKNFIMPDANEWNAVGSPYFATFMHTAAGAEMSFSYETAYHTAEGIPFSEEGAINHGRAFAKALKEFHESKTAVLKFTGDVLYNTPMNERFKTTESYDYLHITAPLWHELPDCDFLVVNPESPFAGEQLEYTKERYQFNTPVQALEALKKVGTDLVTLANNHAMDRGTEGIRRTLDNAKEAGLDTIGIYRNEEEQSKVYIREIKGIKIAFVNYTYGTNAFHHGIFLGNAAEKVNLLQPEETLEGSVHLLLPLDEIEEKTNALYSPEADIVIPYLSKLEADIKKAKESSDYVIMLLHCGGQYNVVPDAYTKMLCKRIKEYGANIIITNHPHIILSSELDTDGYFTAYCLGNLFAAKKTEEKTIDPEYSAVLRLELEKDGTEIKEHISFSLCKAIYPENGDPYVQAVNTADICREDNRNEILTYANRFFPAGNYAEIKHLYPIK